MKNFRLLWIALCVSISIAHAQETDCDFNFREALFYLKGDANFAKDSLKSVRLLKPCVEKGFDKAQVLMGRLWQAKKTEEGNKKAFDLFKKAAQQSNALAMADLGVLYKYGRGCKLNFNKARKWFKKSAELGNNKAAYSLGYLYLKGFGSIEQDYRKAVKWFKQSDYKMANYWLGVCYLKGYGVAKDIQKASELLGKSFISNNLSTNTNESANPTTITETSDLVTSESITESNNTKEEIAQDFLLGNWKGTLLKLDWSKKQIEAKKEINIGFQLDSLTGTLKSILSIDKDVIKDDVLKIDNSIYFENTNVLLPHDSYKENIPNTLNYEILSSDLSIKTVNGITYLVANIESYIKNWNEAGIPLRLVLQKTATFNNTDEELSNDALIALSKQANNFIKLYPNPFKEDLIISYSLTKQATVKIQLSDLQGNIKEVVENNKIQEKGDYRYFLNGSHLKKGAYVVSVFVNNERKTRVIIKK